MISLLANEVRAILKSKRFPVPVTYGTESFKRDLDTCLIVFHREGAAEVFPSSTNPGTNPRPISNRSIGFSCRVFAKSPTANARREDHEVLCDLIVNGLVCAIVNAANKRRNGVSVTTGHLLTSAERDGQPYQTFPGVVYELQCSLTQTVFDRDWEGNGLEEVQLTAVTTDVFAVESAEPSERRYAETIDVD